MKKILLLATAFVVTMGAFAQTTQPAGPKADDLIKVNVDKHDFGKIIANTPVNYSFEIKNISDKPIVVENTWASCGCTTPKKIVDPILPGKTALLEVNYNAAAVAPPRRACGPERGKGDQRVSRPSGGEISGSPYDHAPGAVPYQRFATASSRRRCAPERSMMRAACRS